MRSRVCRHSLARGNNIADKIPSTCLAGGPASANNIACAQATDARREAIDARTERATVMTDHAAEATLLIKWLENKMNYCLLWNSSKLSSGRETETPRNKSRRSNMLSHPRKLLSSSMDGAGKIFYHPARLTQQHIKPVRIVGAVRRCGRGFWVRRLSPFRLRPQR